MSDPPILVRQERVVKVADAKRLDRVTQKFVDVLAERGMVSFWRPSRWLVTEQELSVSPRRSARGDSDESEGTVSDDRCQSLRVRRYWLSGSRWARARVR